MERLPYEISNYKQIGQEKQYSVKKTMYLSVKISVLVPVYKVEPYLQRCIDSVLAQDFQDWEMILVDDGSPDQCPEICDEAARKDARITVVHKENGGLPSARLAGFEQAKADYLVFLDSDDWLLEGALSILYKTITSDGGYDIVKSRPLRIDEKGGRTPETYQISDGIIEDRVFYGQALTYGKIHPYLHSGIYRKELFSEIIFKDISDNNISFCEDWFANMMIIENVHKVKSINLHTYAYFCNKDSIVGTSITSPQINLLIEKLLGQRCRTISQSLYHALEIKMQINNIRSFFYPELPFSKERFEQVRKIYATDKSSFMENIDPKFLKFINCFPLYLLYTQLYKFFFLRMKIKGKKRIVLYSSVFLDN